MLYNMLHPDCFFDKLRALVLNTVPFFVSLDIFDTEICAQVDVIFTATPQGLCASLVNEEILSKVKIIDLSADFRIII